jgi:prophage regulatory protein
MARRETTADPAAQPAGPSNRLISQRELQQRLTLSRSTIWRMSRQGAMPPPIQLTPSRIAWRESDIENWIADRAASSVLV